MNKTNTIKHIKDCIETCTNQMNHNKEVSDNLYNYFEGQVSAFKHALKCIEELNE